MRSVNRARIPRRGTRGPCDRGRGSGQGSQPASRPPAGEASGVARRRRGGARMRIGLAKRRALARIMGQPGARCHRDAGIDARGACAGSVDRPAGTPPGILGVGRKDSGTPAGFQGVGHRRDGSPSGMPCVGRVARRKPAGHTRGRSTAPGERIRRSARRADRRRGARRPCPDRCRAAADGGGGSRGPPRSGAGWARAGRPRPRAARERCARAGP